MLGFELDECQEAAVTAPLDTHVLVTAPPGSGKTRVLTARYVYLMKHGVPPQSVVAVTFTNKAAQEMKDRIGKALDLPEDRVRKLPIATFHSLCARWLRRYASKLGYKRNFTICDQYHSERVVEGVLESLDVGVSEGVVAAAIARLKDELVGPEDAATYLAGREGPATTADLDAHTFSLVYREYQRVLHEMNAMDFGDLIAYAVRLFGGAVPPSRLGVRYLLVDECQDINTAQYELIRLFADGGARVFLVGDLDQCLLPGTLIATPSGQVPVEQIVEGGDVVVATGHGKTGIGKVSRVAVRRYSGKVIRLVTESGREVVGTPEHCVFARSGIPEASTAGSEKRPKLALTMFASSETAQGCHCTELSLCTADEGTVAVRNGRPYCQFRLSGPYDAVWRRAMRLAAELPDALIEMRAELGYGKTYLFMPLSHVREGMYVPVAAEGEVAEERVVSVSIRDYSGPVFDLDIPVYHNYVAGGVVVHNSIYGWRGSRPRLIRLFAALYEPQRYRLVYNYRSRDAIVQVANAVIKPNYADADTFAPMQAVKPGGRVKWFNIPYSPVTYKTIPHFPTALVRSLVEAGAPPGSIAVLCRYAGPLESVWRSLLAAGVPARLVKMRRGLKSPLQPFVLVAANPQDTVALRVLLEQLRDVGPVLAEKITHLAAGQGSLSSLVVALRSAVAKIGRRRAAGSVLALVEALEKLRDALVSAAPGNTLGDVLREPAEVLLSVVNMVDGNINDVETALEMAGNYPADQDGLVELASMLGLVSGDVSAHRDEMVTVSTIHAAKGLEYDVVVLLEVPSRLFYDSARWADQEERRVFYVGLTRAAERLYIVTYLNEAVLHDHASFVHAMLGGYSVDPVQLKSGFMMDMAAVAEAGDDVVPVAVPAVS